MSKRVPEVACTLRVTAWVTKEGIARIIGPRQRGENGCESPTVIKEPGAEVCGTWELAGDFIPYFPDTLHGGRAAVDSWLQQKLKEGFTVTQHS
jgi:hypothetical protein